MRLLSKIFERVESGSDESVRAKLDIGLGVWTAEHGSAHKIVAVSESRVCFVDHEENLYVAAYVISEDDKLRISGVNKLCNVLEESEKTDWLEDDCKKVVAAISENREDDADKLIANILEVKTWAVRARKRVRINDPKTRHRNYMKLSSGARRKREVAAARTAHVTGWKKAKVARQKLSMSKRKTYGLKTKKAMEGLNAVTIALLHSMIVERAMPFREFVSEVEIKHYNLVYEVNGEEKTEEAKTEAKAEKRKKELQQEHEVEVRIVPIKEDDEAADESYIDINLRSMQEQIDKNDPFIKSAISWGMFRDNPIDEATSKLLEEITIGDPADDTAKTVLNARPWLGVCSDEEIYEFITPHMTAFDPNVIEDFVKQIIEMADSEDGVAARAEFLDSLQDEELVKLMEGEGRAISGELDKLFLEASRFNFGAADDLGNDNLDNDSDPSGMAAEEPPGGEEDLGGEEEMDLDSGTTVEFSMDATEARESFRKIMDVVSDEIQDNEEFDELRQKLDDEEQELTGEDITDLLSVVGDYFEATGRSDERRSERDDEGDREEETLDDMDDAGMEGDFKPSLEEEPQGVGVGA